MLRRRISILSVVIPVFAAATAVSALIALAPLLPQSGVASLFPLAQPHVERGASLLNGAHGRDPKVLADAEDEARKALAVSPGRADAWLMIAYVERMKAGRFSSKAREALDRSYLVGPLDPDVSAWRLEFCFDQWSSLPSDLKADAMRELTALWSRTEHRQPLRELAPRIDDPSGRLTLRVQLALLERGSEQAPSGDQ